MSDTDQHDAHDGPVPPPVALSAMERITALETKVDLLLRALSLAFGERWMDELKGRNEPTGQ